MTQEIQTRASTRKGFVYALHNNRSTLVMLMPATLLTLVFAYLPMGGILLAFKEFNYQKGLFASPWVGLTNFRFFFQSGQAALLTGNTFAYNLAFLVINTFLAVAFAIVLSEMGGRKLKRLTQSVIFLPTFMSWVIVASIVYNMFNYEHGMLNGILRSVGMRSVDIYSEPSVWKYLLVFFKAWKEVGYTSIIYFAAVTGVDSQLYEAAEIDGANIWKRVYHITLPSIRPTIITMVLLAVGQIFRGDFGLFYQLVGNNGLLYDATDIIDTYVFRSLMQSSDIGMSAAVGAFQSVLCFVTIVAVNQITRWVNADYALY